MSDSPETTPEQQASNGVPAWAGLQPGESNEPVPLERAETNIMLHGYRDLTELQAHQLRRLKDDARELWIQLHQIDGSALEPRFVSRELEQAALRLEESLLWAEKHFNV